MFCCCEARIIQIRFVSAQKEKQVSVGGQARSTPSPSRALLLKLCERRFCSVL